ncbi:MAG: Gfo/Idh/MocA family oxidoreductase [Desulfobacterales bacterium]|nr:Gfo/Idh/MocA family oxidoreductase [Desulfobacterales bacterium]
MKKLKIGLVGAGKIAQEAHVPALIKSVHAELSVLVESDFDRAVFFQDELGIDVPHIDSLSKLNEPLDGVIICTPNHTHVDLCLECFDMGINVLVEKPLALTYQDALRIKQRANETNCVCMVGYCTRFWPSVQIVKKLLGNKALGDVKKFVFQFGSPGGWAPVSNYILSKNQAGGGAFINNATHYLDRMIWCFGEPTSYSFYDDSKGGIEANALAEFSYSSGENDFSGVIRASKTVVLQAGCFIECEKGVISHQDWASPMLSIRFNGIDSYFPLSGCDFDTRPDMYLEQIDEFVAMIKGKQKEVVSSFDDAIENVRLVENLYSVKNDLNCDWYNK